MLKKSIAIITHSFLDQSSGTAIAVGGVETWVQELVKLLSELEIETTVYQTSQNYFKTVFAGASVTGLGVTDRKKSLRLSHDDIDKKGIEKIIYASSIADEKYMRPGQVFIQHGIHWDYTTSGNNFHNRLKWEFIRRKLSRNDIRMCLKSRLTIAVDSNFINYARIVMKQRFNPSAFAYIPNFAWPRNIEKWGPKWEEEGELRIIFARRFEYRRGVNLFADVAEKLVGSIPDVKITFAGCGSYEKLLKDRFGNSDSISVTEVPHENMYDLLCESHISVIPTIYSEGTSLSCLEAMASGCAVVATNVGGLCNIVIPGYNGLLLRPIADEFTEAIIFLANNRKEAARLAGHGHELVSESFSAEMWRIRIRKALEESGFIERE